MPQHVIVNGKPCIEYSPQELDAIRLELEIKKAIKEWPLQQGKVSVQHYFKSKPNRQSTATITQQTYERRNIKVNT